MTNRLYRSRRDRMIGGVCGGLGAYFGIDPVIVRLIFVVLTIWGGVGVLLYIVCWIIMPPEERIGTSQDAISTNIEEIQQQAAEYAAQARTMFGGEATGGVEVPKDRTILAAAILIALGVVLLLGNIFGFSLATLWPLLLIALGVYIVFQVVVRR